MKKRKKQIKKIDDAVISEGKKQLLVRRYLFPRYLLAINILVLLVFASYLSVAKSNNILFKLLSYSGVGLLFITYAFTSANKGFPAVKHKKIAQKLLLISYIMTKLFYLSFVIIFAFGWIKPYFATNYHTQYIIFSLVMWILNLYILTYIIKIIQKRDKWLIEIKKLRK